MGYIIMQIRNTASWHPTVCRRAAKALVLPIPCVQFLSMALKLNAKSLEDTALAAMHNDLVDNLEFAVKCASGRPLSSRTEDWPHSVAYSSLIGHSPCGQVTTAAVVTCLREKLSQSLVGVVNDSVRQKLLLCFDQKDRRRTLTQHMDLPPNSAEMVDFFHAYLDCVLDDSVLQLSVPDHLPASDDLFEIISQRSPCLQELQLHFSYSGSDQLVTPQSPQLFISSLQLLTNLTSLSVFRLYRPYRTALFQHVGSSFPALTSLTISKFPLTSSDLLALVVGGHNDVLQRESARVGSDLHWFQLAPELVTPLCRNIRQLHVASDFCDEVSVPLVAFLLRHMPRLEECVCHPQTSLTAAVQLLHQMANQDLPDPDESLHDLTLLRNKSHFSGYYLFIYVFF